MTLPEKPPAKINGKLSKLPHDEKERIAAEILEEYQAGGKVKDSAAKRGISDSAAYGLMARYVQQEFKDAEAGKALAELASAEDDLTNADKGDHFALAKADRRVKHAQWKLERVLRDVYGQHTERAGATPVIIQIANLRGDGPPIQIRAVAMPVESEPSKTIPQDGRTARVLPAKSE